MQLVLTCHGCRLQADPETGKVTSTAALLSATLAGSFGSGLTTPLDVIKTRMQSAGADPADGFLSTARKIVASEGQGALWKAPPDARLYRQIDRA